MESEVVQCMGCHMPVLLCRRPRAAVYMWLAQLLWEPLSSTLAQHLWLLPCLTLAQQVPSPLFSCQIAGGIHERMMLITTRALNSCPMNLQDFHLLSLGTHDGRVLRRERNERWWLLYNWRTTKMVPVFAFTVRGI